MKSFALLVLACSLAGCPATVVSTGPSPSRPAPDYPPPAAPRWDSTGWTLLGEQTVDGKTDRDVILVSKRARWDKLTLLVEDSDLELLDLQIEFANGERWSPRLTQPSATVSAAGDPTCHNANARLGAKRP